MKDYKKSEKDKVRMIKKNVSARCLITDKCAIPSSECPVHCIIVDRIVQTIIKMRRRRRRRRRFWITMHGDKTLEHEHNNKNLGERWEIKTRHLVIDITGHFFF